jgi:regulator of RNase E activity RraA
MQPETRDLLAKVSISTLTTCLYRKGLRNVWLRDLRAVSPGAPCLVGPAYTMRFVPAREDVGGIASYGSGANIHQRGFEECPPGHVLVMDTHGETGACCCGDLLIARLRARGVAGIVSDGGFRDSLDVAALAFPAYHRQPVPSPSFLALQAVDLQVPIGCAGVAIYPGDIMVGDGEGVVAIPAAMAHEIAAEAWWLTQYDSFAAAGIAAGHSIVGLYPASAESRAEFEIWRSSQAG